MSHTRILFVFALLFIPFGAIAQDACSVRPTVDNFKEWVDSLTNNDSGCVDKVLARYQGLERTAVGNDVLKATNAYHAAVTRFFEIINSDDFDEEVRKNINDKVQQLGKPQSVSEFKPVNS